MYQVYTITKNGQEVWGVYPNFLQATKVASYVCGYVRKVG